ncbi:MAG: MaoC/PaaZ C-terminal domain-containing protein [Mycobacteriaceae bacterium]
MGKGAVVQLTEQPKSSATYLKAIMGMLPTAQAKRRKDVSDKTLTLNNFKVDLDNLASYTAVTGLRLSDTLPLTYPFILGFPTVMSLITDTDFPIPAMGSVHVQNVITRYRPISVSEPLDIKVRAENLREHRSGLMVDAISELYVGRELVSHQVSTFLNKQRTSLSDEPKPETKKEEKLGVPNSLLRVSKGQIRKYAAISGDRNPIHMATLGAKAFGFPTVIAHGMWSAAAVLNSIEGKIPNAVCYTVRFGKPILLPATISVYTEQNGQDWNLSLRNRTKGYPHLTGSIVGL